MTRLSALDTMFLALESEARPMHAGILMIFEPPSGDDPAHLDGVVEQLMAVAPVDPFDRRPVRDATGLWRWETVDRVDLTQHVQRVDLPSPGSITQLMELTSELYVGVLDRRRPLWSCTVIGGLEDGRFAFFFRAHHALADGITGVRIIFGSLSESAEPAAITPIWGEQSRRPRRRSPRKTPGPADLLRRLGQEARGSALLARNAITLLPRTLGLIDNPAATPFTAPRIAGTAAKPTPERSFATFDLPLSEVREVAEAAGGTVNDVVLAICDAAVQGYFAESGEAVQRPLLASMAVSTRAEGDSSTSNAAAMAQVRLGDPDADPDRRLAQIIASTKAAKADIRRMSPGTLQFLSMGFAGAAEIRERMPVGRGLLPQAANLLVSNIPGGPSEPRYLGSARLEGVYALPILPPSHALNITLGGYDGALCFGIGADRAVIPDTPRIAELALDSFAELAEAVRPLSQPAPA